MSRFVEVPVAALESDTLQALLEEYASRDGTDYGEREMSLEQKVSTLRGRLQSRHLVLLFDTAGETWDLVERDHAASYLNE